MTRIHFYFNVTNKTQEIAEMVRAGIAKRRLITIGFENEQAASEMSAALWHAEVESFLPNLPVAHEMAAMTPVHLHWPNANVQVTPVHQDDMLINLNAREPLFFSRFRHLIELVGTDEADKTQARARFKFYRDRGYEIKTIDRALDAN